MKYEYHGQTEAEVISNLKVSGYRLINNLKISDINQYPNRSFQDRNYSYILSKKFHDVN